jgi:hypothetical protein
VLVSKDDALVLLGEPVPLPPPETTVGLEPQTPQPAEEPPDRSPLWMFGVGLAMLVFAAGSGVVLFVLTSRPPAETAAPPAETQPVPMATASNVEHLVDEGWTLVASDPEAAAGRFRAALAITPRDARASYGLGYALLRTGAKEEATGHLCHAKSYADRETSQEVTSLLEHEGLRCP